MPLISKLSERLERHPKRVVFPEGSDPRILQAARKFASRNLGVPILLGDRSEIKANAEKLDISLEHIRIIDPSRSDEFDSFVTRFKGFAVSKVSMTRKLPSMSVIPIVRDTDACGSSGRCWFQGLPAPHPVRCDLCCRLFPCTKR